MTVLQTIAALLMAAALVGYVNLRWLRLSSTIVQMGFALLLSTAVIALNAAGLIDFSNAMAFVSSLNFSSVFLDGMLAFLLFAAALHIDLADLRKVAMQVLSLATIGLLISTFITGSLLWGVAVFLGFNLPYFYALLFGALISPTDPIAVLAVLKKAQTSRRIYAKIGGESLLNDGVAIVTFGAILGTIVGSEPFSAPLFFGAILWKVLGGIAVGLSCGLLTEYCFRTISDYKTEILLTLALASGGYVLADLLQVSSPIAVAVAGLVVGNRRSSTSMSGISHKHLFLFWELLDEILNAILFILMGVEMIIVPFQTQHLIMGFCAIPILLFARFISVSAPIWATRLVRPVEEGTVRLLTWGGMRGGISIAMALALPVSAHKDLILVMTYIVVVFSILVQGITFPRLVKMMGKSE